MAWTQGSLVPEPHVLPVQDPRAETRAHWTLRACVAGVRGSPQRGTVDGNSFSSGGASGCRPLPRGGSGRPGHAVTARSSRRPETLTAGSLLGAYAVGEHAFVRCSFHGCVLTIK